MRDTERSSAMPIRIAMLNVISAYREITPKVLHDTPFHTPQYRHLANTNKKNISGNISHSVRKQQPLCQLRHKQISKVTISPGFSRTVLSFRECPGFNSVLDSSLLDLIFFWPFTGKQARCFSLWWYLIIFNAPCVFYTLCIRYYSGFMGSQN